MTNYVLAKRRQKAEYLKNPNRCPYCGSDNIEADGFDGEGNEVWCFDCKHSWFDAYTLTDLWLEETT